MLIPEPQCYVNVCFSLFFKKPRSLVLQIEVFGFGHDSFTPKSFTFHPQLHSPCHSLATLDK